MMTPEEAMALQGFFDDEPDPLKDVVGLAAVALGGFTMLDMLRSGFDPSKVSLGVMELGGGLLMMRQAQARNMGKAVITAGVLYDMADKVGLIPTPGG
jgi:hypothetical protein